MAREIQIKKEQLPAVQFFAEDANDGFDGLTAQDYAIPFFSVLQKMSPQLDTIDGAKAGQIFNSVTEECVSELIVIPCAYKREFIEWRPREQGGGYVGSHTIDSEVVTNASKVDGRLISSNGNLLVETANHFVLALTANGLDKGLITMSSTQLKKNRRWNSLMGGIKFTDSAGNMFTPARYSHQYKLTTQLEQNDKGSWYGWVIEIQGPVEDKALYQTAKSFGQSVSAGEVKTTPPAPESDMDSATHF
jgi:hypothetical protein